MKRLFCGGSAIWDLHRQRFNEYLPNGSVYAAYGMTEVPAYLTIGSTAEPMGSVGLLGPGLTVRILDDNGMRCGPGVDGELAIHLDIPCLPYWNDETQSKVLLDAHMVGCRVEMWVDSSRRDF